MSVICPHCQTVNSPKSKFCTSCGKRLFGAAKAGDITASSEASTTPLPETDPDKVPPAPSPAAAVSKTVEPKAKPPLTQPAEVGLVPDSSRVASSAQSEILAQIQAELKAELPQMDSIMEEVRSEIVLGFAYNFNRLFIEGYNTTFQISLTNTSPQPLEKILVHLECGAWGEAIERRISRLAPGQRQVVNLDTLPAKAGNFLLKCSLKLATAGRELAYLSSSDRTVTVMTKPGNDNLVLNIVNSGANAGLGQDLRLNDLINREAIRSVNDLIQAKLETKFEPLDLALDYDVSLSSIEEVVPDGMLAIPRQFLGFVQTGVILKLIHLSANDGKNHARATHLIARPEFRIGKNQEKADLIAWFLPRNPTNDAKTMRISRTHCSIERRADSLWIIDHKSLNYTTFDQERITAEKPMEFTKRGVICLSGEYFIDAMPFPTSSLQGPLISNLGSWSGPPQTTERPSCGCVRFTPSNIEEAFHKAIWLLADGTFGTSRANPIVFETPGLHEIQGRFHHWRGCFWVENIIGNSMVRLDGIALKSNEIAPLGNGLLLELGATKLRVEIGM